MTRRIAALITVTLIAMALTPMVDASWKDCSKIETPDGFGPTWISDGDWDTVRIKAGRNVYEWHNVKAGDSLTVPGGGPHDQEQDISHVVRCRKPSTTTTTTKVTTTTKATTTTKPATTTTVTDTTLPPKPTTTTVPTKPTTTTTTPSTTTSPPTTVGPPTTIPTPTTTIPELPPPDTTPPPATSPPTTEVSQGPPQTPATSPPTSSPPTTEATTTTTGSPTTTTGPSPSPSQTLPLTGPEVDYGNIGWVGLVTLVLGGAVLGLITWRERSD